MIPLIKVVSLFIRLFSRPVINYFKVTLKNTDIAHPFVRTKVIALGQFSNLVYTKAQRVLLNTSSKSAYVKPLTEAAAIEDGIELIGETLFYGTLLTWGTWELYKYTLEARTKEEGQRLVMTGINSSLSELDFKFEVINADLKHLHKMLDRSKRYSGPAIPAALLEAPLEHDFKIKLDR